MIINLHDKGKVKMTTKKETTEVRREQIVRAALTIIGEEGIQGLTTVKIAKAVGVSEANLYRHFKNKDAILTAAVDDLESTLSNNLKIVGSGQTSPLEKLGTLFKRHLTLIEGNRGIPRLVFSSELHFRKDLRERLASLITHYLKGVSNILKAGVKDGSIKGAIETDASAAIFIGMIQLSALRWSLSDFKTSLTEEGDKLWQAYRLDIEEKK